MNLVYLLDTSVYFQPIKKQPLDSVIKRWKSEGDQVVCTSIICETELLQHLEKANSSSLWKRYEAILKDRLPLLPFDIRAARVYAKLQAEFSNKGRIKPVFDLMIASICISNGLILATTNSRDLDGIPNLEVEDWSLQTGGG